MPSPFPGMDPWLENPAWWSTVHSALIHEIWRAANAELPAGFVANVGERIYVVAPARSLYPDVVVVRDESLAGEETERKSSAVAVADAVWEVDLGEEQVREPFVEILAVGDEQRVVSVVEVLSPTNKTPGDGRELYLRKQRELLAGGVNLLEVDLLRSGMHTVVPPLERLRRRGHWDYLVSLARGGETKCTVWPIVLRHPLPTVLIPLVPGAPDLALDLQPLLDRVYDEGSFAKRIDYSRPPAVPLSPANAEWAGEVLRKSGTL